MAKEKHYFVEDDIIARNDLKKMELKTIKDIDKEFLQNKGYILLGSKTIKLLQQLAVTHIRSMRREGRDDYYRNIDEKSAIPKLIEIFNLNKEYLENGM